MKGFVGWLIIITIIVAIIIVLVVHHSRFALGITS